MSLRPIKEITQTQPTIEGAGVKLQRASGFGKTKEFDPFLLLDDFRNDNLEDYVADDLSNVGAARRGAPFSSHFGNAVPI